MSRILRACIDRAALRANLAAVRRAAPGSRVMAVVKANAYGHGLVAVASTLAGGWRSYWHTVRTPLVPGREAWRSSFRL